ncbi:ABC transporter substrate-binding protein [Ruminococcaceae bacterium OttesenSCG-928-L11]|nr:ABC transporter substrate-binding protein [Ruminococcaceae bacterium OttesenSCG-928-L11]
MSNTPKSKRVLAFALVVLMLAVLFAGCGGGSQSTASTGSTSTASQASTGSSTAASSTAAPKDDGPATKVTLVSMTSGDSSAAPDVSAEVSKISKEKINVELNITLINQGSYKDQLNLMLSSGEDLDIFLAGLASPLATYVNNGQIIPLDDLMAQYGSSIYEALPIEYIEAGRVSGELYGLATNRDLANYYGFFMRKDLCKKYDIDYENIHDLDALEEALIKVRDGEPGMYPVASGSGGSMVSSWGWDALNDRLGVLMNCGLTDLNVVNLYETDEYRDFVTRMRKWEQMGIIMPDAANNPDTAEANMKAGKAFGGFGHLKPNTYLTKARSSTHEIAIAEIIPAFATTSNVQGLIWAIATNSKAPDKAMQMLNLMYEDPDITNLTIFGIEGTHWKFVDEANAIINYADGVDAMNTTYTPVLGWMWPNQFIGHIWEGDEPDVWEVLDNFNRSANKSMAMGFAFDNANVKNEVTACMSVLDKYHNSLMCGSIDPETTLDQFNKELYDAGLQNIIDEKQKQLDEWAAVNKK